MEETLNPFSQHVTDTLYIYEKLLTIVPVSSMSDQAKSQTIAVLLSNAIAIMKTKKDLEFIDAQIAQANSEISQKETLASAQVAELEASTEYKIRQTTSLDEAVRRDTARIACDTLGIIKSSGGSAGDWWKVASAAINNLSGDNTTTVDSDPV